MAVMPGVQWRPLPRASTTRMARFDLVAIHTCVGSFEGTDGYFRSGKTTSNSHFLTGGAGEIRQLVDTAFRSAATGAGNHRSISIENADMGPGFPAWNTKNGADVPAFTPAQIEANARICAWANRTHGVPLVAADTSRPNARGVGYHRLGCNPWRVPDGELWSSATGKVCPGNRRIAQIPQIIARAKQIAGGITIPPAPVPEDDMPHTPQDIARYASDGVANRGIGARPANPKESMEAWEAWVDAAHYSYQAAQQIAGLTAAVNKLAGALGTQQGVDPEALRAVIREEMAKVVQVEVSVTDRDA